MLPSLIQTVFFSAVLRSAGMGTAAFLAGTPVVPCAAQAAWLALCPARQLAQARGRAWDRAFRVRRQLMQMGGTEDCSCPNPQVAGDDSKSAPQRRQFAAQLLSGKHLLFMPRALSADSYNMIPSPQQRYCRGNISRCCRAVSGGTACRSCGERCSCGHLCACTPTQSRSQHGPAKGGGAWKLRGTDPRQMLRERWRPHDSGRLRVRALCGATHRYVKACLRAQGDAVACRPAGEV
jgi:hypothetical protein